MNARLLSIGEELLSGAIVDTNSAWLSSELAELGVVVCGHESVGDDPDAMAAAILRAAVECDVVICTGGLGPTADDLTREVLANVAGVQLAEDPDALARIEAFFAARHRPMSESNRIQAQIPVGGRALSNVCGTAPGVEIALSGARVFALPGVPSEMREMFARHIAPALGSGDAILRETVLICGVGESRLGERIADLMQPGRAVTVGTGAKPGEVSIRLRSTSREAIDADVAELKSRLGDNVVGMGEACSLAGEVGRLLAARGETLATAESCTGGAIGAYITAISGSSGYYRGGVVTYANEEKHNMLAVPMDLLDGPNAPGAVSEPVARKMAQSVKARTGATWAISVTGIAGPTSDDSAKPVGLVYIGIAGPAGTTVSENHFHGGRNAVRQRTVMTALDTLRRALGAQG
ncbi:MAG: competence/damage-inducible protein A [Phycisphaerales bacterium]|nr:competence/damage-inducible protein A [Phycisphaerales bacterium]